MYKIHDIEKMKELKRRGYSQSVIAALTGASKQIVSYHTKGIEPPGDFGLGACIYCKSKRVKIHHRKEYKGEVVYVACRNCHARGPSCFDIEDAIIRWNAINK